MLLDAVGKDADAAAATRHLFHNCQMAFLINVHNRLDTHERADNRAGCRQAAAAIEEHQVIDGEPVNQVLNMLLDPLGVLLDGHALFAVLQRIMHQQALACRRASAVNHDDFLIRVLRRKFLRRVRCGGISAGQSAGKRNAKDILTLVQQLLEAFLPRRGIDGGGLNHHAAAELTISLLFRHFRRSRNGGNAIDRAGKRHDLEIMLCLHPRLRHVSGRIRNNIVHFCPPDVLWGAAPPAGSVHLRLSPNQDVQIWKQCSSAVAQKRRQRLSPLPPAQTHQIEKMLPE